MKYVIIGNGTAAVGAIEGIRSTQLRDYLAGNGLQRIRRMFAPPEGGKS